MRLPCPIITPLGRPVVPEVYITYARSSGPTVGRAIGSAPHRFRDTEYGPSGGQVVRSVADQQGGAGVVEHDLQPVGRQVGSRVRKAAPAFQTAHTAISAPAPVAGISDDVALVYFATGQAMGQVVAGGVEVGEGQEGLAVLDGDRLGGARGLFAVHFVDGVSGQVTVVSFQEASSACSASPSRGALVCGATGSAIIAFRARR